MSYRVDEIKIANAKIFWTNFTGRPTKFDKEGHRTFCVEIPEDMIETLKNDGWNIKMTKPRYEDEEGRPYIQVAINYNSDRPGRNPKIFMVTSGNKNLLNEETVGSLDYADIKNVDLIIRPYMWEVNGKTGVKAYAKIMYVTIEEDYFAKKYETQPVEEDDYPF